MIKLNLKTIIVFLVINLIFNLEYNSCTTAIVSGKFTVDGRPLLLKHRDSNFEDNRLVYFTDGKFDYIGLVNSVDKEGKEVWGGVNSAGFAIMNSASYNLKDLEDTTRLVDQEGVIMKLALQRCETVADFEKLLEELPKPLGVEANFGVIDAKGAAAYFETNNFHFKMIDANNPTIAPFGYIIRTNYSFSSQRNDGYGYIRYQNAEDLFYQAVAENNLDYRFLLQSVSRSLKHSLTGVDLSETYSEFSGERSNFVSFTDFIPRNSSVSTIVVKGVRPDESPEYATLWGLIGFPLCTVAMPVWVSGGDNLPKLVVDNGSGNSPLCSFSLALKKKCFPIERGSGYRYINVTKLLNAEEDGFMQKLMPIENEVIKLTERNFDKWHSGGMDKLKISSFYSEVNSMVENELNKLIQHWQLDLNEF